MNTNNNLNSSILYVFNNGKEKQYVCGSVSSACVHNCLCVECKQQLDQSITMYLIKMGVNDVYVFQCWCIRCVNEWHVIALACNHTYQYLFRHAIVASTKLYIMS